MWSSYLNRYTFIMGASINNNSLFNSGTIIFLENVLAHCFKPNFYYINGSQALLRLYSLNFHTCSINKLTVYHCDLSIVHIWIPLILIYLSKIIINNQTIWATRDEVMDKVTLFIIYLSLFLHIATSNTRHTRTYAKADDGEGAGSSDSILLE